MYDQPVYRFSRKFAVEKHVGRVIIFAVFPLHFPAVHIVEASRLP